MNNFISKYRKQRGFTQKELARLIGMSVTILNRWESNERQSTLENAIKIAQILDVSLDKIFGLVPPNLTDFDKLDVVEQRTITQLISVLLRSRLSSEEKVK